MAHNTDTTYEIEQETLKRIMSNSTDSKQERRKHVRRDVPAIGELRAVFHRLWTSQVGQPSYVKRDWCELRTMVFRKFGVEL